MKILYITHVDMKDAASGSSVRPVRMLRAFKELGWDVDLISGFSNPANAKERTKTLRPWIKKIKTEQKKYDFCYIEPPTGPMFTPLDLKLMKLIHKKGIPMGIFYRDAHWKLAKWFKVEGSWLKLQIILAMQRYQWRFFNRVCDAVYVPTESFFEPLGFAKKLKPLPPAGELRDDIIAETADKHRCVYVGQCTKEAGVPLLLEAMELVNREVTVKLSLVCREPEYKALGSPAAEWMDVHHISGRELEALYRSCDLAVIPREDDDFYMNITIPIKFTEYLSFGFPIVAVDVLETSKYIKKYDIGFVCKSDARELADLIIKMYKEPLVYAKCRGNVIPSLKNGNLWIHRAQQVAHDLLKP